MSSIKEASNDVLVTAEADTGPGFDGAKLEHIFPLSFYTTSLKGWGIGLAGQPVSSIEGLMAEAVGDAEWSRVARRSIHAAWPQGGAKTT